MIITPNSALVEESVNAVTASRFPSCQHFWQCKETSGTTLTDAMGNADLIATSMTFPVTDAVLPVAASSGGGAGTIDGTLYAPAATDKCLLLFVGKIGTATTGLFLGNSGTSYISLAHGAGTNLQSPLASTANLTDFGTPDVSTITARAIYISAFAGQSGDTTGAQTAYVTSANAYTANTADDLSAGTGSNVESLADLATNWACPSAAQGVQAMYGLAFFKFTTALTAAELKALVCWSHYYWQRGYKTLPPWLVGRA